MLNYYEETMPLETDEDAYKKYLIDENLPLFDKLNIIIKKGDSIQKQALLNSLNIYINDSLFKSLIEYIISEIVTWDIEVRLIFPRCLNNILLNYLSSINNEIFNIIFKHMIISISSGNERISKEYIFYFDIIIENFTKQFNNGKTFPYQIGDDIFEIIISLGKFGQNPENIRLCCYLSSCMCRLVGHVDENENIQKMFKRICLLFGDLEKITERQISRELRYLIPIFKEKILEKKDIIKAIKSYINHDWDHAIQTTTIVSLLENFEFINDEIKELVYDKIKEIFEEINYEKEHKNNIIQSFINVLYKSCVEYETKNKEKKNKKYINYDLNYLIDNALINMKFLNNWVNKEKVEPLLIINFDKISTILNYSFLYNENSDFQISSYLHNLNPEERININIIFFKIFSKIIPRAVNNDIGEQNTDINDASNSNLTKLLLINLYKMIPCINNLNCSKNLYEKIISIFKKDSIIPLLKIYADEFTENNYSKNHNYLYKLLFCLLEKGYNNLININSNSSKNSFINNSMNGNNPNIILLTDNNYFFKLFQNILESIFIIYKSSPKLITCQIHFLLAKTFQKIIKVIYKYYKPYSQNNREKNNNDKLFDEIFNEYLIHIIKNDEIGNQIKIEYINVIPYLILYGKNRQNYYNFVEDEVMKSSTFYMRRCSINFIEKCLSIYSFKLFLRFDLMEIIYYLINDENNIISTSIIEKIIPFHKKMMLYSKNIFDKITSIISEMDSLYKDDCNADIEKKLVIKKLLNLNNNINNNQNNNKEFNNEKRINFYGLLKEEESMEEKESKKIKSKEAKHIMRENEIFGKSYSNINLHNTISYLNKINDNEKIDKKLENENNNEKANITHNEDLNQNKFFQKDKNGKKKLLLEKSFSGIIQNINTKLTTKKLLPKIKQYVRKNSCDDKRSINFNISMINGNNNNNNLIKSNQIFKKSLNLNKIMLLIKDKTPEKKNHLRSINNRLPSASSSKAIDSFSINVNNSSSFRPRHLYFIQNKLDTNICLDDTNYQVINVNNLNKSTIMSNIIGYSGKDFFKQIIKGEMKKNQTNKGIKLNQNNKKVILYLKNGFKDIKFKKDETNHKIVINAKINEINKSNK